MALNSAVSAILIAKIHIQYLIESVCFIRKCPYPQYNLITRAQWHHAATLIFSTGIGFTLKGCGVCDMRLRPRKHPSRSRLTLEHLNASHFLIYIRKCKKNHAQNIIINPRLFLLLSILFLFITSWYTYNTLLFLLMMFFDQLSSNPLRIR